LEQQQDPLRLTHNRAPSLFDNFQYRKDWPCTIPRKFVFDRYSITSHLPVGLHLSQIHRRFSAELTKISAEHAPLIVFYHACLGYVALPDQTIIVVGCYSIATHLPATLHLSKSRYCFSAELTKVSGERAPLIGFYHACLSFDHLSFTGRATSKPDSPTLFC
jgi:hypothetical protein